MGRLKWRQSPDAVIDSPRAPVHVTSVVINTAGPGWMSRRVVLLRPLSFQHGLGLAVTSLLSPIAADRIAAMMPDDRCWAKPQCPTFSLQSPANIDVIARDTELRVECADGFEAGFAKSYVAARNMFGLPIGEQHVAGTTGRAGHTLRNRPVAGRRDVRAAHCRKVRAHRVQESSHKISQPVRIRI